MLSPRQQKQFSEDGYIVLPDFKSAHEIDMIKNRALQIVSTHDFKKHKEVFSTDKQRRDQPGAENRYLMESDRTIRCFFEEKAFDNKGKLAQPLDQSINKIGHALHDRDPLFETFSTGRKLAHLAMDLGLKQPQIWQSMYIFKQPRIGGQVDWHQDGSFFYTEPLSVTTFWFALDDATLENGCLWVEKGGHKNPLRERFVRAGEEARITSVDPTPWPDRSDATPLEVKAGTLVCFHGKLPHFSAENTSDKPRHAYTLHAACATTDYVSENWIQSTPDFPVRGFNR